ncbi:hypothetical protein V1514DRAFT_338280, partial [Lipomyces japonicus]|uniref:uncharacterized protein n=1 Tax=Lipomyces japonicus TaxID=56871 RepID=UPI0034CEBDD5
MSVSYFEGSITDASLSSGTDDQTSANTTPTTLSRRSTILDKASPIMEYSPVRQSYRWQNQQYQHQTHGNDDNESEVAVTRSNLARLEQAMHALERSLAEKEDKVNLLERSCTMQEEELQIAEKKIDNLELDIREIKRENGHLKKSLEDEKLNNTLLQANLLKINENIPPLKTAIVDKPLPSRSTEYSQLKQQYSAQSFSEDLKSKYEHEISNLRLDLAQVHNRLLNNEESQSASLAKLEILLIEERSQKALLIKQIHELEVLIDNKTTLSEAAASIADSEQSDKTELDHKGMSTLAEEILASRYKDTGNVNLEKENKELKDKNLAMAAYIENIVQKLLSNKNLEHILESNLSGSSNAAKTNERRKKAKPIGIGITINADTNSSILYPNIRSPNPIGYPSFSGGNDGGVGDPSSPIVAYRRASSNGQKSLIPLKLSDKSPNLAHGDSFFGASP